MNNLKFPYEARLRAQFREGSLGKTWAGRYPNLFDDRDVELLKTDHQRKYHFHEWLAAVLLYESTGFVSLIQKYTCQNHPRKVQEVRRILPPKLAEFLLDPDASGAPDLLAYSPDDESRWFFCEVKGPGDELRAHQRDVGAEIYRLSGREMFLLELFELP